MNFAHLPASVFAVNLVRIRPHNRSLDGRMSAAESREDAAFEIYDIDLSVNITLTYLAVYISRLGTKKPYKSCECKLSNVHCHPDLVW